MGSNEDRIKNNAIGKIYLGPPKNHMQVVIINPEKKPLNDKSLYLYAKERGIGFSNCGKIIVATSKKEEKKLNQIILNAERNGLILEKLSQSHLKELEPELVGEIGLLSRTTGIIDIHDLMTNFNKDLFTLIFYHNFYIYKNLYVDFY